SGQTQAALREARDRARTLGILTGTLPARGPGIVLTVVDPQGTVGADVLLDAVEELRDAGAEALQLSGVCVVAQTPIVDDPAGGEGESTKSVSEVYAPVTGEVTARNDSLDTRPELVNQDPYGDGWLFEVAVADGTATDGLLDASAYQGLTTQT